MSRTGEKLEATVPPSWFHFCAMYRLMALPTLAIALSIPRPVAELGVYATSGVAGGGEQQDQCERHDFVHTRSTS